ncbi:MAG: SOS response-associated peptidase [Acidimicrobiia bacterium]
MCGRFVQAHDAREYAEFFDVDQVAAELPPSYNVAPTDAVYAIAEHEKQRLLGTFRWGLLPFWAKDRKIAARNINARVETAAQKPAFRESFARRRCIVPADGFYEWQPKEKGKLPHYIFGAHGEPLALAGLWASWKDRETGERLRTCTILTGTPNDLVEPVHDRMPVILARDVWAAWLDPGQNDPGPLRAMLDVYPSAALGMHPVSTLVNKVQNNVPELIVRLETPAADPG